MLVEFENSSIRLKIPVGTGKDSEQHIIERDKPFDPAIFGLAHRCPGALSAAIDQLRLRAEILNNGDRRFVSHVADNLYAAIVAIRNSEEI
ncbi:MAG: hypothetical protein PHE48_00535 [Candidatus Daviesbacteria bacterium]|nr:hypothetical protein [Candidatus Daviesbacteria bacterium]